MPKFFLCLDPGGSETKVIYQPIKDEKPRHFLMSPEVEEISRNNFERYLERELKLSNPAPSRQAYLEVNQQIFAVGHFASKFDPKDRLREVKYENALYKVLAAVGIVIAKNNLNPQKNSLYLAVLLPWTEYEDRKMFQKKLKEYLSNFTFRGEPYSLTLDGFVCYPEGGGLAALYTRKQGENWQQDQKLGVLMFGHRNITALNFHYGELAGDSPLTGFSQFLDKVVERTSGLDRHSLASSIFSGLESYEKTTHYKETIYYKDKKYAEYNFYPFWKELESIKKLAHARNEDLRTHEIDTIHEAIRVATNEYWETVRKWLEEVFPDKLDEVIISGGASKFLQPDLERYFNCKHEVTGSTHSGSIHKRTGQYIPIDSKKHFTPIVWGAGSVTEIEEILSLKGKEEREKSLSHRLIDAYGLFEVLISKYKKRTSAKNTKQKEKVS